MSVCNVSPANQKETNFAVNHAKAIDLSDGTQMKPMHIYDVNFYRLSLLVLKIHQETFQVPSLAAIFKSSS